MKRLLWLLLFSFGPLLAQQPIPAVQLFNNIAAGAIAGPGTGPGTIPNVGQTGHQVFLVFSGAPGHSCTSPLASATLQFSFDAVTYYNFGSPTNVSQLTGITNVFSGFGAFPYVRFNLIGFDTTDCRASGWYTALFNSPLQPVQGPVPVGTVLATFLNDSSLSPLFLGGIQTASQMEPLVVCDKAAAISVSAASTSVLINGSLGRVRVCSLAVTISAAGTVAFIEGATGTTCGSSSLTISPAFTLAQGVPLTLGSGLGYVMRTAVSSDDICVSATGGTAQVFAQYMVY